MARLVGALDDRASRAALDCERAFLRRLGGGCLAPATAYARIAGERLRVDAMVGSADGVTWIGDGESGHAGDGEAIGERLAERMLAAGGRLLLERARRAVDAG
jgi:hydroxymethylbilane synthase